MVMVPSKYLVKIKLDNEDYIIYHSLFGGAIHVTKDVLNLIQRFSKGLDCGNALNRGELTVYKDTLLELKKRYLLVKEGSDERTLFSKYDMEKRERELAEGKYITGLILEMVNYCNFRCRHCFEEKIYDRGKNVKMSFSTAKFAIDGFINILKKAHAEWGVITLWGGEPLLNWKGIKQIIEYADEVSKSSAVKIAWRLTTNGSLLNDSILRSLKQHNFKVVVSLDGIAKENDRFRRFVNGKGTFKSIIKGIEGLSRYGISYSVELVLNDYNFYSVERVIDLVHDKYKCKAFTIGPILLQEHVLKFDQHTNREKAKRLVELYDYGVRRKIAIRGYPLNNINRMFQEGRSLFHCNGINCSLYIKPSGLVWPCPMVRINIGNVQEIEKIPQGKSYKFIAMRGLDKINSCRGCEIEGFCAGGCTGIAEFYSGNIYDTSNHHFRTFYCDLLRNVFIEMLKYLVRK